MLWTATPGIGTSRSHTSNIAPAQLAERFGLLPSQWTVDVERNYKMFANPVFIHPGRYWCSYCPIMAQNRPDMWRFTFDFGAAQLNLLRHRNCAAITVLVCEQTPCDFGVGATAALFNGNTAYSPTATCWIWGRRWSKNRRLNRDGKLIWERRGAYLI